MNVQIVNMVASTHRKAVKWAKVSSLENKNAQTQQLQITKARMTKYSSSRHFNGQFRSDQLNMMQLHEQEQDSNCNKLQPQPGDQGNILQNGHKF